jgi:hypothetical protein
MRDSHVLEGYDFSGIDRGENSDSVTLGSVPGISSQVGSVDASSVQDASGMTDLAALPTSVVGESGQGVATLDDRLRLQREEFAAQMGRRSAPSADINSIL